MPRKSHAIEDRSLPVPAAPIAHEATDFASAGAGDPDFRHRMISAAAYERYMQRGYVDGYDTEDWLAAEAEFDARMRIVRHASG